MHCNFQSNIMFSCFLFEAVFRPCIWSDLCTAACEESGDTGETGDIWGRDDILCQSRAPPPHPPRPHSHGCHHTPGRDWDTHLDIILRHLSHKTYYIPESEHLNQPVLSSHLKASIWADMEKRNRIGNTGLFIMSRSLKSLLLQDLNMTGNSYLSAQVSVTHLLIHE